MKASILLDSDRPKVPIQEVIDQFRKVGMQYTEQNPDLGVVVGGDGVFSYFGRLETIPLLFVGVRGEKPTGSRAHLAEVYFEELGRALRDLKEGRYEVVEYPRLEVLLNAKSIGEVFTDVYLERGADGNCLRFKVFTKGEGFHFTDFVIGNGVAVTTQAGSTGYFSYLDKIRLGDWLEPERHLAIGENELGICYIVPTYSVRDGTVEHPLRYTVPYGSEIRIQLIREADARLYGVYKDRSGIKIGLDDIVTIRASKRSTRVVKVAPHLK